MGLLDRLLGNAASPANTTVFSFLAGSSAPEMKISDYLSAYSGWVYACVNAIAEEIAATNLTLQQRRKAGWTDVDDHIALGPLTQVNPFMSSSDLLLATQAYLERSGDAFWYLPQGTLVKKPLEIWLLDPSRTYAVKNERTFIGGYVYKNEKSQEIPLKPEQVIHFKRFNPRKRYRGIGTVQAAALAIDIDTYAAKWNRNFFFNAAMPSTQLLDGGSRFRHRPRQPQQLGHLPRQPRYLRRLPRQPVTALATRARTTGAGARYGTIAGIWLVGRAVKRRAE